MRRLAGHRSEREQITAIREFNRLYTAKLGLLRRRHLDGEFSLAEARILYEIGRNPLVKATFLSTELHLDKGYLSRLLAALVKKKLITQTVADADARERILELTESGRRKVSLLDEQSTKQIRDVLSDHSATEREVIAHALTRVRELLEQDRPRIVRAAVLNAEAQAILNEYMEGVGVVQRDSRAAMRKIIQDPAGGMWLARLGGNVVGCVVLRRLATVRNACEVKRLYVRAAATGRGIAMALLDILERHAAAAGFKWVYLDSKDDLKAALSLYRKREYRPCKPYNDNPQATIFLCKQLR